MLTCTFWSITLVERMKEEFLRGPTCSPSCFSGQSGSSLIIAPEVWTLDLREDEGDGENGRSEKETEIWTNDEMLTCSRCCEDGRGEKENKRWKEKRRKWFVMGASSTQSATHNDSNLLTTWKEELERRKGEREWEGGETRRKGRFLDENPFFSLRMKIQSVKEKKEQK